MARNRTKVRDRITPADESMTTVRCQKCRGRVGLIRPIDTGKGRSNRGWDGTFSIRTEGPQVHGPTRPGTRMLDLANEDWNEITCSRCGHIWRGRNSYLHDLARVGGQVTLGQAVRRPAPVVAPLTTSRDW